MKKRGEDYTAPSIVNSMVANAAEEKSKATLEQETGFHDYM
jgi:hypothetical protein